MYYAGFEFVSSQAPYNMRGLLIGLFFSIQGIFSLLSVLIQYLFSQEQATEFTFKAVTWYSCAFWFYLALACLAAFGVIVYVVAACRYKKRKRDDMFNQVGMLEEYFSSGRIHSSRWT